MAWELDPDLAVQTRVSLGRRAVPSAAIELTGFALSLVPDHSPLKSPRHLLAAAIAFGCAAGLTQYYAIDPAVIAHLAAQPWYSFKHWPSTFAVLAGALAAAGLAYGWIAHNRFGVTRPKSMVVRMLPILLAAALGVLTDPFRKGYTVSFAMTMYGAYLAVLIVATAVIQWWRLRINDARTQS